MEKTGPVFRIPETVKEDTYNYENQVSDFVAGKLDSERFKAYRVPMYLWSTGRRCSGFIYGQGKNSRGSFK